MRFLSVVFLLLGSNAWAQQSQPDTVTMQRAIIAVQQQRERAANEAVGYQIEAQRLSDELTKAQARIKELEAKIIPPEPSAPGEPKTGK